MTKLLQKPFKAFTIYALIILACSIPAYYLVIDSIWHEELDEHNRIIKTRIEQRINKVHFEEGQLDKTLEAWNQVQPGTKLQEINRNEIHDDSIYTVVKYNEYQKQDDRFRGLVSCILIDGKPYRLTIESNIEEVDETLWAIAVVTILFFSLLLSGIVILNRRMTKRLWKPFNETLIKLKDFELNKNRGINFEKSNIQEFEELNSALTKLIEKNVHVFDQQKTFIENASHELQTPLAVLKSKIDLLMQSKSLTEDQLQLLTSVETALSRVTRINKNLLLLAKIENDQFLSTENVELSQVLEESVNLVDDYISAKQISIKIHTESLQLACNKTLLEILVNNLLINAIIHNQTGGEIKIRMKSNTLTVSNSGNTKLNNEHLFKRFAISSSENTNSGLGLAIVKEICNRYQWTVNYTFDGSHHFSITF